MTVAVPVRNGGALFGELLASVRAQRLDLPIHLLVADSGSTDNSRDLAHLHDAELIDVRPGDFSHGATRNLLTQRAAGSHVAFLTQDAVPADENWLAHLLAGFEAGDDVGLVFGPYRARPEASLMVRRELDEWFASLSTAAERGAGATPDVRRTFFTDANGCLSRAAWERVPFRPVGYAEDQLLARDMLAAGYAKVYRPDAVVIHSHHYGPVDRFRRSFDEWRGLREVGAVPAAPPLRPAALGIQRAVRDDLTLARAERQLGGRRLATAVASLGHHSLRAAGAALGARADRLPPALRQVCSLEGRAGFDPLDARS